MLSPSEPRLSCWMELPVAAEAVQAVETPGETRPAVEAAEVGVAR